MDFPREIRARAAAHFQRRRAPLRRYLAARPGEWFTAEEVCAALNMHSPTTAAEILDELASEGLVDCYIHAGRWRYSAPAPTGASSAAQELAEMLGVSVDEARERAVRATLGRIRRSLGEEPTPQRARSQRGRA